MIKITSKGISCLFVILFLVLSSSCSTRYGYIPKVKKPAQSSLVKKKNGKKHITLASKPIVLTFSTPNHSTPHIYSYDTVNEPRRAGREISIVHKNRIVTNLYNKVEQHDTSTLATNNNVTETHLGIDNFTEVLVTMILGVAATLFFAIIAAIIAFAVAAVIESSASPLAIVFYGYMIALFLLFMIVAGSVAKFFSGIRKKLKVYVGGKPHTLSEIKKMNKAIRVKHNFFNFIAALILTLFLSVLFLAITNATAPLSALLTFFGFWCLSGITLFYFFKTIWLLLFVND